MKRGDIIRNRYCPSDVNPTRVGLMVSDTIAITPEGMVIDTSNYGENAFEVVRDSKEALELLFEVVALVRERTDITAMAEYLAEKEAEKNGE